MRSLTPLREIITFKGGGTPSKKVPEYWDGDIPWATVKDFTSTALDSTQDFITQKGLQNSSANMIPKGHVIIPTRMSLGKVAINTVDLAINQDLRALIPKNGVDTKYLLYAMLSLKEEIVKRGSGATVKGITQEELYKLKIPVPPLDDQVRIAYLLSKVEGLIAQRKEGLQQLDELLKSVFMEMFGDPVRNEKGWVKKNVAEFATVRIGPFGSLLHAEDYITGGVPLVNPSHIVDGEICPDQDLTITEQKFQELSAYHLAINDVVVARRGEIGRCALVRSSSGLLCGTGSMFVRIHDGYEPIVLQHQIYKTSLKDSLESKAKGVTMKNLNSSILENLSVICPPLSLQKKFVSIVKKIDVIRNEYLANLLVIDQFFDSLSQKAFKGGLDLSKVPIALCSKGAGHECNL